MNNNRCVDCGFLNFADASACKRCKATLDAPSGVSDNPFFNNYVAELPAGYQTAPGYAQPAYSPYYFPGAVAPLPRASKDGSTNAVLVALVGVVLAVAVGIGVLWKFGHTASANFAWQEYNSKDESYTILMPTKPAHVVQNRSSIMGELQVHMMMADMRQHGAFMVGHADYPDDYTEMSPEEMLDLAEQGAVNSADATLLSKKSISLDGHPGVELEITMKQIKGGGRTVTRIYWVAPRMYIMFASAPKSAEMDATLAKFLDSLKIRKKQI
jgi:hypothetical protein